MLEALSSDESLGDTAQSWVCLLALGVHCGAKDISS